ncbi:glycopeptide antibiotics resistance protein [Paenibacillus endophyticus]|uniref:Glycopeptide antibiotics resistance protein n=1 Tax=Paenibacillus endophyticus TaxID=1294268 RepID=A0A7W5CF29_9BACL|nr:glycopeptide antibiotics resistance protein [Paenibacillus endophyticus]
MGNFRIYWGIFGKYLPFVLTTLITIFIVFAIIYYRRQKSGDQLNAIRTTMSKLVISLVMLGILSVSLLPSNSYLSFQFSIKIQLIPLLAGDLEYLINVVMYLVLISFVTFHTNARNVNPIFFGMMLSLFIEVMQFLLPIGRIASVTDFILNSMGSVIGFCIVRKECKKCQTRVRRKVKLFKLDELSS